MVWLILLPSVLALIGLTAAYRNILAEEQEQLAKKQAELYSAYRNVKVPHWRANERGNGLIGAIMALVIISVASVMLTHLMISLNNAQATTERKALWMQTKATVSTLLLSNKSCGATVAQYPNIHSINLADNTPFIHEDKPLGHSLTITAIQAITIGQPSDPIATMISMDQNGASHNYRVTSVANGSKIQQLEITIFVKNSINNSLTEQDYYVNMVLDNNNLPTGCSL